MRFVRSIVLRLARILMTTACIGLVLMAATLLLQLVHEPVNQVLALAGVMLVGILFSSFIIRKIDSELSAEVARLLYPSGAILSVALSWLLSLHLAGMLNNEGSQHWVVTIAGVAIAAFLLFRCFDIKWLPSEIEIADLERTRHMDD